MTSDIHQLSSLAWTERSALEIVKFRLLVRFEFNSTAPEHWMATILDEDLRRAYEDAELARLELVRCLTDITSGGSAWGGYDIEEFAKRQEGVWRDLFIEHSTVRKRIKIAIRALESSSEGVGLTAKATLMESALYYTGRPSLRAVPR